MTFDICQVRAGDLILFESKERLKHYRICYVILEVTKYDALSFSAEALDLSINAAYSGIFSYKCCQILARASD